MLGTNIFIFWNISKHKIHLFFMYTQPQVIWHNSFGWLFGLWFISWGLVWNFPLFTNWCPKVSDFGGFEIFTLRMFNLYSRSSTPCLPSEFTEISSLCKEAKSQVRKLNFSDKIKENGVSSIEITTLKI